MVSQVLEKSKELFVQPWVELRDELTRPPHQRGSSDSEQSLSDEGAGEPADEQVRA